MLEMVLRLLGVDLQQHITRLKAHAEEITDHATARVRQQVEETSLTLGLAFIGAIAAASTVVMALVALFIWLEGREGRFVALAGVGVATAAIAALMFALAAAQRNRKPSPQPLQRAPSAVPPRTASAAPPAAAPVNLGSFVPPPPPNANLLDVMTHRVNARAAAASDEAIDTAAEFVRTGSREALLATLTVVALVGVLIGRRK